MWRCSLGEVIARPPLDLGGFLARELVRLGDFARGNEINFEEKGTIGPGR